MSSFSGKKLLLLGFVVVLMVIIPLTVYLVQQQQKLSAGAEKASSLSFVVPSELSSTITKPTDLATFEVWLDPSTNQVSFVKLAINYDATKLSVNTFPPDAANFPTVLQPADKGNGKATVTLSVGTSPENIIKIRKRVATISFNALQTATAGQVPVTFDSETQVLSIGAGDQFNENVLQSSPGTSVTIAQSAVGGPAASPSNQVPVCTSSTVDKGTTGTAPYAINLQAAGTDSDGTITKVNYDWGDTQTENITEGFGIGTNSVNITKNHTYNNGGAFVATVKFTDNLGGVSTVGSCTKTFNITGPSASPTPTSAPSAGGTGTGSTGGTSTIQTVVVATPAPTPVPTSAPSAVPGITDTTKGGLPAVGPGDNIISFGSLGILSIIIGAIILLAL